MSSLSLDALCSLSNLNLNLSNSNDCCEATFCSCWWRRSCRDVCQALINGAVSLTFSRGIVPHHIHSDQARSYSLLCTVCSFCIYTGHSVSFHSHLSWWGESGSCECQSWQLLSRLCRKRCEGERRSGFSSVDRWLLVYRRRHSVIRPTSDTAALRCGNVWGPHVQSDAS